MIRFHTDVRLRSVDVKGIEMSANAVHGTEILLASISEFAQCITSA